MSLNRPHSRNNSGRSSSPKNVADNENQRYPSYVVPTIVDYDEDQVEQEHIDGGAEYVEPDDKNQHFFSDQVKFTRPHWNRPLFCCMAMSVAAIDKSAVSSFPAKVADNGGLAFLLVYLLAHTFLTFPMMYMECILGQYFQISMIGIWGICPIFKSITYGLYLTAFTFTAFHPTVVSWAGYMFVDALNSIRTADLPWATCTNLWNTCVCNGKRHPDCASQPVPNDTQLRDPTDEYFVGVILKLWKTQWEDPGDIESVTENGNPNNSFGFGNPEEGVGRIRLTTVGILAGVSLFIFVVNSSRYRVAGNLYTFTTLFPLMVMTLLICRGMTLEGGMTGVLTYLKLDWAKLLDIQVWISAISSAVYSLALGEGIHLTIASFNPLHHNLAKDVWMAVLLDSLTNFMGCVVSYAFLGHLYWRKKEPIPDIYPGHGSLFQFTLFPYAVSDISASAVFALLYYLMIIFMAADTCIIYHQVLTYSLYEDFRRKYPNQRVSETMFRCIILGFTFIFGLTTSTRGGFWFVAYADNYLYGLTYTLYPLVEIIAISWIWGLEELCHATLIISGQRPSLFLRLCWKYVIPSIFSVFLFQILSGFNFEPISELGETSPANGRYVAQALTFLSTGLLLLCLLYATEKMCRKASGCRTILMLLLSPEYEHDQIKEDLGSAKRLHLRHYLFLRFPDEVESTPFYKIPARMLTQLKEWLKRVSNFRKKRSRVGFESSTQDRSSHGEHHHHHHDPKAKRSSLWDLAEHKSADDTAEPEPPPPQPEKKSWNATTRIGWTGKKSRNSGELPKSKGSSSSGSGAEVKKGSKG